MKISHFPISLSPLHHPDLLIRQTIQHIHNLIDQPVRGLNPLDQPLIRGVVLTVNVRHLGSEARPANQHPRKGVETVFAHGDAFAPCAVVFALGGVRAVDF